MRTWMVKAQFFLTGDWHKVGNLWRRQSPSSTSGIVDYITNTCQKIFFDEDFSDWAYQALDSCKNLLKNKKRWPDWYGTEWNGRKQNDMTRDPYTSFYTLCIYLGKFHYIKEVKIPFKCNRISFWMWRRYLIKPNSVRLTLYRFLDGLDKPKKDYVVQLRELIEWSIRNAKL